MKIILFLLTLSFCIFSCQNSTPDDMNNIDLGDENTYECAVCGATITQSMLENGEANWTSNSNSPGGVDHVCAKHNSVDEPDPVSPEEECSDCGSNDIGVDEQDYVFCNNCGSYNIKVE